jgi:capsular polysaccharide transport system permease protein
MTLRISEEPVTWSARRDDAFAVQRRVVVALIHREILSRFGRSALGFLWAVLNPLLTIALLTFLFTFLQRRAPIGDNFVLFYATGIIPYMTFRFTSLRGFGAFASNVSLFEFPTVKPLDALISRALLEFWTMVVVGVIVFFIVWLLDFGGIPRQMAPLLAAYGLIASFGFGISVLNACLETFFNSWSRIYRVVVMMMFYTSGIFFVPDFVPEQIRQVIAWNPLLHIIELYRSAFYAGYGSGTFDQSYVLWWSLGVVPLGMALERVVRAMRQK